MQTFNREELLKLINDSDEVCISIYMPVHKKGLDLEQDPIRLRNIMRRIETRLNEKNYNKYFISDLVEPLNKLIADTEFWKFQNEGLAIFLSRNYFRHYCVPVEFEEKYIISTRFSVKHLIPLLNMDKRFFVLALDKKNIKLYEGSALHFQEVEMNGIPTSMEEALQTDEEEQLMFRQSESGGWSQQGFYKGPGYGTQDAKPERDILRFFQMVDKGLFNILKEDRVPLILAGVEYLIPIFREANSYQNTLQDSISRNTEDLSLTQFHKIALEKIEPLFDGEIQDALIQYGDLSGSERISDNLEEIVRSSFSNRITFLFVDPNASRWGRFIEETYDVHIHDNPEPGDDDLIELAVTQTILHNGTVYSLKRDKIPGYNEIAAIFRY